MTKKTQIIVLGTIIAVVLYLSVKLPNDEKENIRNFGVKGIGTLTKHGLKTVNFTYEYQGESYTYTWSIPFSDLVEGEQYEIEIYTEDPSRILVNMDKPHIDTLNYKWAFTEAKFVKPLLINHTEVEFKYLLNGRTYRRLQKFNEPDRIPKDLSKLKIIYRLDKPEISYITYATNNKTYR